MLRGRPALRSFARSYIVPSFEHLSKDKGLPGLFSEKGLNTAWFDRAEYYTEKLNKLTGQTHEKPLENIILESAKSASKRDIFNYASLLHNLKFSFSTLHGNASPLLEKPDAQSLLNTPDLSLKFQNEPSEVGNADLRAALINSFGSIVEFRTLLLNSNLAISGDGFTWLVARQHSSSHAGGVSGAIEFDKLFILNTYNVGSPHNFNRVGHVHDLAKQLAKKEPIPEEDTDAPPFQIKSIEEAKQTEAYKNIVYVPLLAIDASPKAWLHDYGVFGKQQYLDRVWESTEWSQVEKRLPSKAPSHELTL
ncbi:LAMI_0B03664g1_1 [Lachancea mirantina]|uniref:LAMI_0B03664g1_1 n=1 Tax=Lachancea mirantina TaxID=1230905 RepID=A0A1G4IVF6_9SACH|nr:LAMI_0B03664g1_1 [Lachancea mirantina]